MSSPPVPTPAHLEQMKGKKQKKTDAGTMWSCELCSLTMAVHEKDYHLAGKRHQIRTGKSQAVGESPSSSSSSSPTTSSSQLLSLPPVEGAAAEQDSKPLTSDADIAAADAGVGTIHDQHDRHHEHNELHHHHGAHLENRAPSPTTQQEQPKKRKKRNKKKKHATNKKEEPEAKQPAIAAKSKPLSATAAPFIPAAAASGSATVLNSDMQQQHSYMVTTDVNPLPYYIMAQEHGLLVVLTDPSQLGYVVSTYGSGPLTSPPPASYEDMSSAVLPAVGTPASGGAEQPLPGTHLGDSSTHGLLTIPPAPPPPPEPQVLGSCPAPAAEPASKSWADMYDDDRDENQ